MRVGESWRAQGFGIVRFQDHIVVRSPYSYTPGKPVFREVAFSLDLRQLSAVTQGKHRSDGTRSDASGIKHVKNWLRLGPSQA